MDLYLVFSSTESESLMCGTDSGNCHMKSTEVSLA